jgi:acetyl esterase/lipase
MIASNNSRNQDFTFRLLAVGFAVMAFVAVAAAEDGITHKPSQSSPEVIFLWPAGSPTLQGADEKEITTPADPKPGQRINSIKNIHNPSIEVHLPPADKANGTAIIVAPGGGHKEVNVGTEGTDIAKWLNDLGIAVVILKYRLAQTPGYHYTVEGEALQDTQRAMRIVRARAKEWGVDPERVGILGFSAGGALAALADIR